MRRPFYLGILAQGLGTHGQLDAAHVTIEEALTLSQGQGEAWCMPELLRVKGDLLRLSGPAEAPHTVEALYREAIEWARRQGALSWELRSANSLAELWHRSGGSEQARHVLGLTYGCFVEGFETRDLIRARLLLDDLRRTRDACSVSNVVTLLNAHPSVPPPRRKS
jgi:predicted ATPase